MRQSDIAYQEEHRFSPAPNPFQEPGRGTLARAPQHLGACGPGEHLVPGVLPASAARWGVASSLQALPGQCCLHLHPHLLLANLNTSLPQLRSVEIKKGNAGGGRKVMNHLDRCLARMQRGEREAGLWRREGLGVEKTRVLIGSLLQVGERH